ncbi:MAG: Rnase Y domain-containing protein, partial [Lachnospiraceae bacterium]|nr:Rnase Y domain-containing protein [Lachnospiraceae bacterium]
MNIVTIIVALVVAAVVGFVCLNFGKQLERKQSKDKIGNLEQKSRQILDDAIKKAETTKVNALLEAKQEILKQKTELENEIRDRRKEVAEAENRAFKRDELSEKKAEMLDQKETQILQKEQDLKFEKEKYQKLNDERTKELERVSGYCREQAKNELFEAVKEDIKHDTALYIKEQEQVAKDQVENLTKDIIF